MKLLFAAPRFHTNQIPLARALAAHGHDVHYDVLAIGTSEDHGTLEPHVVEPALASHLAERIRAPKHRAAYVMAARFPSLLAYRRRLGALRPDVIVIRDFPQPFAVVAAAAARSLGIPIVLYSQGPVHARPRTRARILRGLALRALDAPWYSPVEGDPSQPKVHRDAHYVPFAADVTQVPKSEWFAGGHVHILAIGKFVPRKNLPLLVRAFAAVRARHASTLTIIGEVSWDGHIREHAKVLRAIEDEGLQHDVILLTNRPHAEVVQAYGRYDLFVLPSRAEPAAVSILEAMTHGLPVICSTSNGTRCYIEHGTNGFVFESDDLADLTRVLIEAVADRERLVRMGGRSRALATTAHHPDAIYHAFMRIVARAVR